LKTKAESGSFSLAFESREAKKWLNFSVKTCSVLFIFSF